MEKRPLRLITGKEIVERGRIVTNCNLPEVGHKEVTPNNSWLETKQVQYALESRKKLVAAERIDKVGSLSHAEWRDEQGMAEVTQQVGGHWQYLGHTINGTLFLMPEEALFLIETNCLLLKHNNVTVSIQKAYNLLLNNNLTLTQYKAYAWLSRIGYKVLRHKKSEVDVSIRFKNNMPTIPPSNTEAGMELDIPMPLSDAVSEKLDEIDQLMTSNIDTSHKKNAMTLDMIPWQPAGNDNEATTIQIHKPLPIGIDGMRVESERSRPLSDAVSEELDEIDQPMTSDGDTSNKEHGMTLDMIPWQPAGNDNEVTTILIHKPQPICIDGMRVESERSRPLSDAVSEELDEIDQPMTSDGDTSNKEHGMIPWQPAGNDNEATTILIHKPQPICIDGMRVESERSRSLSDAVSEELDEIDQPMTSDGDTSNKEHGMIPWQSAGNDNEVTTTPIDKPLPFGGIRVESERSRPLSDAVSEKLNEIDQPMTSDGDTSNKEHGMTLDMIPWQPAGNDNEVTTILIHKPQPIGIDGMRVESERSRPLSDAVSEELDEIDQPMTSDGDTSNKEHGMIPWQPAGNDNEVTTTPIDKPLPFGGMRVESERSRPLSDAVSEELDEIDQPMTSDGDTSNKEHGMIPWQPAGNDNEVTTTPIDKPLPFGGMRVESERSRPLSDAVSEELDEIDQPMTSDGDTSNKEHGMTLDMIPWQPAGNANEATTILIDKPLPFSDDGLRFVSETTRPLSDAVSEKLNEIDQPMTSDGDTSNKDMIPLQKAGNANEATTIVMDKPLTFGSKNHITNPEDVLSIDEHGVIRFLNEEDSTNTIEMENVSPDLKQELDTIKKLIQFYKTEQIKIKNRKVKASDPKRTQEIFKDIPDCYDHQVITVKVPHEKYLPRNVFLNNTSYVLNLQTLKSNRRRNSVPRTLIENKVMHRTRNSSGSGTAGFPVPVIHTIPPLLQQPIGFVPGLRPRFHPYLQRPQFPRHFNPYWCNMNFVPNTFGMSRPPAGQSYDQSQPSRRKRHGLNVKNDHLRAIMEFAIKLKQFVVPPNNSLNSLFGLMSRFNEIYNEKIRITPDLDVIDDNLANIVTIELDHDEVQTKKPGLSCEKFDNRLNSVKSLAARLRNYERKNQSTCKHRRTFVNLLKHFNETYDTDYQLDSKGELIDKKIVVVDSSSDSEDVVATDNNQTTKEKKRSSSDNIDAPKNKKRKILRNPFNLLKNVNEGVSTSQAAVETTIENNSMDLTKYFGKNWLPDKNDFGSAYICYDKDPIDVFNISQQLYANMDDPSAFNNWVDLKLSIYALREGILDLEHGLTQSTELQSLKSCFKPLIMRNPSHDWPTLKCLRIIKSDRSVQETSLRVDFDVYNKNVQNFRKTDPPKPHFRLVCIDESSQFPSHGEVRALQARYDDNVSMVFGVVGTGSVSFLRLDSTEIPINLENDFV